MLSVLLVASALLGIEPANPAVVVRDSYEAALAEVDRGADAQVRLALWCEAHGLQAERLKHLMLAVLKEPGHPLARGLLGLVAYEGRWRRPEAVGAAVAEDAHRKELVAQYEARRDRLAETAEAHWRLALWCEENGLKPESVAQLWSSLRLDPSREGAWKRLGYKRHNGRWVTDAQLARAKDEAESQKRADRHWLPILEKWRAAMVDAHQARRAEALAGLAGVIDPRAVPAVLEVFAAGDAACQRVGVQVLGQIDSAAASRGLAFLALSGSSAEVRRRATETLRGRDVREYAGTLIALLRDRIKYEVRPVNGPGMPGSIFIEGQDVNVQRRYEAPALPQFRINPRRDHLEYDNDGLPVIVDISATTGPVRFVPRPNDPIFGWGGNDYALQQWGTAGAFSRPMAVPVFSLSRQVRPPIMIGQAIVNTQRAASAAQQQLSTDVASIDRYNAEAEASNDRVVHVLADATGANLPVSRNTWQRWLVDQFGYPQRFSQDQPKPTVIQEVTPDLPPVMGFANTAGGYSQIVSHHSCFGAGTPVHTITGRRPIESLHVGDLVLTQDIRNGALGYQPIVAVHHNPPIETFRIAYGRESIVSSAFHRFWKAGKGWVMARDLKPGDTLRTLGESVKIDAVETDAKQPVFNLDVAEAADFFVGEVGALVHDHSLPDLRVSPFDAEPGPVAAAHR